MNLLLDWCSHEAAKYAVTHWHYSETLPASKRAYIGVWEDEKYIGAVIFALGGTPALVKPYGLDQFQGCELVRVALNKHKATVTQILKICISMIKKQSPGLRLIVSFADTLQGHNGSIYQAGNWVYTGMTSPVKTWKHNGKVLHRRAYTGVNYGGPRMTVPQGAEVIELPGKHRYLYPLDRAMRRQIVPLAQPYPKKEIVRPIDGNNSGDQPEHGGSTPTRTLY